MLMIDANENMIDGGLTKKLKMADMHETHINKFNESGSGLYLSGVK